MISCWWRLPLPLGSIVFPRPFLSTLLSLSKSVSRFHDHAAHWVHDSSGNDDDHDYASFNSYSRRRDVPTRLLLLPRSTSEDLHPLLLSICRSGSLDAVISIHSPVIKLGLRGHTFVNNKILRSYSDFLQATSARRLFDELLHRDVASWTTLMSAYQKQGAHMQALRLFQDMLIIGWPSPNEFVFSIVLRCCSFLDAFCFGTSVHAWVLKLGLASHLVLGSVLVDFYSKYDKIVEALEAFSMTSGGDTLSWTSMISAFRQAKDPYSAIRFYQKMITSGVKPSEQTFVSLLGVCGGEINTLSGKMIHAHMILWGANLNIILKTALVDMYSRCHQMKDALVAFKQTSELDTALWTTLISGYNQVSCPKEAILAFQTMQLAGSLPNAFTYATILSTCSSSSLFKLGKQIHNRVVIAGLVHDASIANALMDMYTKCSADVAPQKFVFQCIHDPNVISWTTLIVALVTHQLLAEAFDILLKMRVTEVQPNAFTLSSILSGCASVEFINNVKRLHAYIIKSNSTSSNETVGNSLLDAYARLGAPDEAWKVFENMPSRDVISYTSLAKGLNQINNHEMVLNLVSGMHADGIEMDLFVLPCFLAASAGLVAVEPGRQLHCYSKKSGMDSWISVLNGLIDMYGKCGQVDEAHFVFMEIKNPNLVSWNSLISGLASNGHFSKALSAFEDMKLGGIRPDEITSVLVLFACSHARLVDLGLQHFNLMKEVYHIEPQPDHYVCLVDLLGRAGRLEEALHIVNTMPFRPDALIYKTLLASCKIHGCLELGESMGRNALELNPEDPAVYVLLSSLYEDAGKVDCAKQMLQIMKERGLMKCCGQSWIELRSKIHSFTAGDTSDDCISDMHKKLESLEMAIGLLQVRNKGSLYHSEKLALAFALLHVPQTAPIRIIKNLRTCEDCHAFMAHSSRIVNREIIMRDGNRFHHFKHGSCSCGGYW